MQLPGEVVGTPIALVDDAERAAERRRRRPRRRARAPARPATPRRGSARGPRLRPPGRDGSCRRRRRPVSVTSRKDAEQLVDLVELGRPADEARQLDGQVVTRRDAAARRPSVRSGGVRWRHGPTVEAAPLGGAGVIGRLWMAWRDASSVGSAHALGRGAGRRVDQRVGPARLRCVRGSRCSRASAQDRARARAPRRGERAAPGRRPAPRPAARRGTGTPPVGGPDAREAGGRRPVDPARRAPRRDAHRPARRRSSPRWRPSRASVNRAASASSARQPWASANGSPRHRASARRSVSAAAPMSPRSRWRRASATRARKRCASTSLAVMARR